MSIFSRNKVKDIGLEEVQEYLGNLAYINSGGCAISALVMYRWLKKNKKLSRKTCFVYLDSDERMHADNKKSLENNIGTPSSCSHVVLLHKNNFIDCYGEYDKQKYSYQLKIKSEEFVVKAINNVSAWNPIFNRKQQIPKIAKHLDIDLSDIKLKNNFFL